MHVPLQSDWPVGQVQVLATQVCPSPHARPQAPQLPLSLDVVTHVPLQSVWPAGHAHAPDEHRWPIAHTRPHAPQFALSLVRLAQLPPAQRV